MTVHTNDVQRLFLQAIFSRGILSVKHAQVLWEKCTDAVKGLNQVLGSIRFDGSRQAWDTFVSSINNALNPLDLEFRHLTDEQTGVGMYAVVNTKDDEIAQLATDYTALEIAYFKAIVEQIMLAPREAYSVSSLAALREASSLSNMTKSQAETVLGSLVAKGWLQKSKRARYSLSTRALIELLPYLKSNYPEEYLECTICLEIITRGASCKTPNCKTRIHDHCFKKLRAHRAQCPTCGTDWPQDAKNLKPVGETAVKDGQDEGRRTRRESTTASGEGEEATRMNEDEPESSRRHGQKKAVAIDVDANEQDEDAEEVPPRSQINVRRRSTRTR